MPTGFNLSHNQKLLQYKEHDIHFFKKDNLKEENIFLEWILQQRKIITRRIPFRKAIMFHT